MDSINEMMQNVVQTVRATYDFFVDMVHGMLNPNQMSNEDLTVNLTQTSGSEENLVVSKPERKPLRPVIPERKPVAAFKQKPQAEVKSSENSVKTTSDKLSTKTETSTTTRDSNITTGTQVLETSSEHIGNIGMISLPSPPTNKYEVGTEANRLVSEVTSPKCTRCIEKNVFCNQECPNTNNNRID